MSLHSDSDAEEHPEEHMSSSEAEDNYFLNSKKTHNALFLKSQFAKN